MVKIILKTQLHQLKSIFIYYLFYINYKKNKLYKLIFILLFFIYFIIILFFSKVVTIIFSIRSNITLFERILLFNESKLL